MTWYAPALLENPNTESPYVHVASGPVESYGLAAARVNGLNALSGSGKWFVAFWNEGFQEWLGAGCVQYTGSNSWCGDDEELIVDDQPYCRKHGEAQQALARMEAQLEADPEYQAGAANGWAEA